MKKTMLWVLVLIFSSGLFQGNAFAAIYSKIEGTILDMEAGILVKDVEVTLYKLRRGFVAIRISKTDINGYFKFNGLEKGEYFVTCMKPGYATYSPKYRARSTVGSEKLRIKLNWGENRYLKIKMVKGGQLRVNVFKKDENDISPYTGFSAQVSIKVGEKFFDVKMVSDTRNGSFYLDGLIPSNKYSISIRACERVGYPFFEMDFEIKKNEITTIEHTFDFTDNTGVTGMIYLDNEPVNIVVLTLYGIDNDTSAEDQPIRGKYAIKNLEPGLYKLRIYFTSEGKEYRVIKQIKIEKNILKTFDIKVNKNQAKQPSKPPLAVRVMKTLILMRLLPRIVS